MLIQTIQQVPFLCNSVSSGNIGTHLYLWMLVDTALRKIDKQGNILTISAIASVNTAVSISN